MKIMRPATLYAYKFALGLLNVAFSLVRAKIWALIKRAEK